MRPTDIINLGGRLPTVWPSRLKHTYSDSKAIGLKPRITRSSPRQLIFSRRLGWEPPVASLPTSPASAGLCCDSEHVTVDCSVLLPNGLTKEDASASSSSLGTQADPTSHKVSFLTCHDLYRCGRAGKQNHPQRLCRLGLLPSH